MSQSVAMLATLLEAQEALISSNRNEERLGMSEQSVLPSATLLCLALRFCCDNNESSDFLGLLRFDETVLSCSSSMELSEEFRLIIVMLIK